VSDNPEDFGPLTKEQHDEYLRHPLKGQSVFDCEEDIKYYQGILEKTTEGDPVFKRFTMQKEATERYLHLHRRYDIYGVSDVISLTKDFVGNQR